MPAVPRLRASLPGWSGIWLVDRYRQATLPANTDLGRENYLLDDPAANQAETKIGGINQGDTENRVATISKVNWSGKTIGARSGTGFAARRSPSLDLAEHYKSDIPDQDRVYLFTGCLGHMLDPDTLRATISILSKLGYDVVIPPAQGCCGALHLHDGDFDTAQSLAQQNITAFGDSDVPIISVVSGCGSALSEYGRFDIDAAKENYFGYRVTDISSFLSTITWPANVRLKPLAAKVLVQDACSFHNGSKQGSSVYDLLGRIPELRVEALEGNATCCGGAGIYPIREPEMATELRNKKLDSLVSQNADFLVSANFGCATHIKSGLTSNIAGPEIIHPVTLIDRQLKN